MFSVLCRVRKKVTDENDGSVLLLCLWFCLLAYGETSYLAQYSMITSCKVFIYQIFMMELLVPRLLGQLINLYSTLLG